MTIGWKNWHGAVEGYEPSIQAAAISLVEHDMASQEQAEAIARHVLWIAGADQLWQHVGALRVEASSTTQKQPLTTIASETSRIGGSSAFDRASLSA